MPAKPPPMITTCGLLLCGREGTNDSLMFALTICQRPTVTHASARFGIPTVHLKRFLCSGAKLEEAEQHFVTFCRERVDGAGADFRVNTLDELLLNFGRQHRVAKRLPPSCHGSGELFEKMLDAAFTATQVIKQHAAHEAPTQARPPAQGGIRIGGADDAFGHKIVNLPTQSGLQTIGDMPRHFLAHQDRAPANAPVEFRDPLDRFFGSLGAAHDFDQWDEVGRIERMTDDATLGMRSTAQLNLAHREPG